MGKDWDTFNEVVNPQGAYENKKGFKKLPRQSTKSMPGFFIPIWKECLRVLKPGAFAFVMCSPRQDVLSRQIVNLHEAGFNVGFTSIYWVYAEGFPKAENIGKAVDKRLGAERKKLGIAPTSRPNTNVDNQILNWGGHGHGKLQYITTPATPEAKALDGSYSFSPKPAVEVIIVAMKPLSEKTYVDQAIKNKKGITWLDDGRIPIEKGDEPAAGNRTATFGTQETISGGDGSGGFDANPKGRFPANLLVSDDALNDGRVTQSGKAEIGMGNDIPQPIYGEYATKRITSNYQDIGSFSRYFDLDKWWAKTFPFFIVSKPSKDEKNRLLEHYHDYQYREDGFSANISGSKLARANFHPTVKPLKLMTYLVTIGSRPNDVVLDPFVGSGTTAIACQLINRRCIGIDNKGEYLAIAVERLKQSVMRLDV